MIYQTGNGAKPRYDGGGTEFGLMHRDLGPGYLMFDIDRLSAVLELNMELRRENEGFVEYRLPGGKVKYAAMYEVKANKTAYSLEALDLTKSNSMVRADMAQRLGCRLFVVFATNGRQPFEFWECIENEFVHVGTLTYSSGDRDIAVKKFFVGVLGIEK